MLLCWLVFVPIPHYVSPQVVRESLQHLPDEASWQPFMQPVHDTLSPAEGTASQPLRLVDPDAARKVSNRVTQIFHVLIYYIHISSLSL